MTGESQDAATNDERSDHVVIKVIKAVAKFCLDNWLVFGFGLATLLAYLFPSQSACILDFMVYRTSCANMVSRFIDVAAHGGIIRSEYSILYGAIALIFFINGMQLSPQKLKEHIKNLRLHILVQGIGFIIIPVIILSKYKRSNIKQRGQEMLRSYI